MPHIGYVARNVDESIIHRGLKVQVASRGRSDLIYLYFPGCPEGFVLLTTQGRENARDKQTTFEAE
jgi:hypothetical protein